VKKFMNEQKHLAQRRGGAEATKKIKQLIISHLCASASLREIVNFFTASLPWARLGRPFGARQPVTQSPRSLQEWEQGRRRLESAVRAYLTVMERNPDAVEKALMNKS
jgi:hypothetical protein